jgi:hypothetical protein
LIAVVRTQLGWHLRQDENELGYYSSLPDAMDVAYTEEWKTDSSRTIEQGNSTGNDSRSP